LKGGDIEMGKLDDDELKELSWRKYQTDLEYDLFLMDIDKIDWSDRKKCEAIAKKMRNLPQGEKMKLCDEIRKRCEALIDLGDDKAYKSVGIPDDELIDSYCWVMDCEKSYLSDYWKV
jgi:hypothetical protein